MVSLCFQIIPASCERHPDFLRSCVSDKEKYYCLIITFLRETFKTKEVILTSSVKKSREMRHKLKFVNSVYVKSAITFFSSALEQRNSLAPSSLIQYVGVGPLKVTAWN